MNAGTAGTAVSAGQALNAGHTGSLYVDTSGLYKLVVAEAESQALRRFLLSWPAQATSELAQVELIRAVRRSPAGVNALEGRARQVLASVDLLRLTAQILDAAATIAPATLRSLDAIHLASALSLGALLGGVVTYDTRLAGAARHAGLPVYWPQ